MKNSPGNSRLPVRQRLATLWPQVPLGVAVALVGVLNFLDGLSLPLTLLRKVRGLTGIAESLSALGSTMQLILGLMLVMMGAGLVRRLISAWMLAVLLLTITIGVKIAREHWNDSLALEFVLLAALLLTKRRFTRRTGVANVIFSLSSVFAVLAYGVFGSFLLGKGFKPEIADLGTAAYFTVVTLATVGFGDIVPATPEARWFVISLVVIGLGIFATAIASTVGPRISGELTRLFKPKEEKMEIKDHVILVGQGAIACNTARELKQRGVAFVQIVTARAPADAPEKFIVEGDATNDAVLQQAGIQRARLVIAAREDDGENAFIALGAKDLNPEVRVLAVASSASAIRKLKLARADTVFSPSAVGGRLLADLVEGKQILAEFNDLIEGHAPSP